MLQSTRLQRVGCDLATEHQSVSYGCITNHPKPSHLKQNNLLFLIILWIDWVVLLISPKLTHVTAFR